MRSGVYQIVNLVTGKTYIGSALNFSRRWAEHRYRLRFGTHHSAYLQRSWNKHGEAAFSFRKLLICDPDNVLMYEQLALNALQPEYNTAPVAGSCRGRKTTEATKRKIADAIRGKKRSPETRARMAESRRKRVEPVVSAETRRKQSEARRGRKMPPRTEIHMQRIAAARRMKKES